MKRILFVLIILSLILTVNVAFAENETVSLSNDIYVSVDGSDSLGDGSADNPYQTLNYTIEKAADNSNIYLKSGTYDSTGYEITNKSISIIGIGDVTIDGGNGKVSQNIFKVNGNSSLVLNNIKFINGFADLDGSLSPIINEGDLKISNCNFYNFTTINGVILNKNSLTLDNISESKLSIDWKSVFGEAGNVGFEVWIMEQIKNNPSRGEFITNVGNAIISNSRFISTVYNNRNMNITNCYISTFISNRSYDMDIKSVIDKSKIMSLRVSNNKLLIVNNSFVNAQNDILYYSNALIQNSTFFNDNDKYSYSLGSRYSNVSIISSSFNKNMNFDYSNVNITYSVILGNLYAHFDCYIDANYNWWGDNKGPRISQNQYSTILHNYWIVMEFDVVNYTAVVDFSRYTNGYTLWDLNEYKLSPCFVKLESEIGKFEKSQGYLVNNTYKTKIIGNNLNTMIYATVDNQLLRFALGSGLTNYTWYVSNDTGNDYFCDGSYENPYKTLSRAVLKAFSGNTIYVMEGVYTLSWNANLKISKNLTFVGIGNAVLSRPNARNIFIVDDKGILNIYNLNFTTFTKDFHYNPLIFLNGGELNIFNSNFYNITHTSGIIYSDSSNSINLDNVTFKSNSGISIRGNSTYVNINNTRFASFSNFFDTIINVKSNVDIRNSIFENNCVGLIELNKNGDYLYSPINAYVYNTTFLNNNWEKKSYFGLNVGISRYRQNIYSIIEKCKFIQNKGHLILCNVIENSSFINNTGIPFSEEFESGYVSSYYPNSFIEATDLINNSYFFGNSLPSISYLDHLIHSPEVYNSIFIKNKAAYGGALSDPEEVHYCAFLNNTGMYGAEDIFVYNGNLNASSNWWGSNQKPDKSRIEVFIGTLIFENWVIMNVTQNHDTIIASLNTLLDDNKTFKNLNHTLPTRNVFFTTQGGILNQYNVYLVNNYASTTLIKNTTNDFDVYVQIDNQKLSLRIYNNSTQLLIDDVTFYGKDNAYKITLLNINGHKISNQLLDVIVTDESGSKNPYTVTTNNNGVAYLNIDYPVGVYAVEVVYYGNGYFEKSFAKAMINISYISTSLYSHDYNYWGKNNKFYAILTDSLGKHLLNQSVSLNIFDSKNKLITKCDVMTGTGGRADALLSLDVGSYKIQWEFLGNEWYEKSSSTSLITINPINTTISLPNVTFYGKGNDYEFLFNDVYGNKISGESVTLKIFNESDSREFKIIVENGVGLININLLPGIYNMEATFNGDDVYGSAKADAILDIQKVFLTFDFKSYATIPVNGVFSLILKDMYGKRVAGQNLSLELYDQNLYKIYNSVSDANGEVNFKIDAPENVYFAIINFGGSIWYNSASSASTINISHTVNIGKVYLNATDYMAYYGENNYFTVLFNDSNKLSLSGIKIPIIISSGDFYKAFNVESDVFGNVRLQITLTPGIYDATYKYENDYYNIHYSKTNTITIYQMPTNLITSDIIVKKGENKNFEVKLVNKNGVAISNLPINIIIDGNSYNVSTNSFGVAKLPLNLDLGYHRVECVFNDINYVSSRANATILVVNDSKTITNIESSEVYCSQGMVNYNVTLFDTLNNPIKSSLIILNLTDDENNFIGSYEAYTNVDGVVIFNLTMTYGKYILRSYYLGNELYFESFNTNYIHVSPLENVTETILYGNDMEIINGHDMVYSVVLKTITGDFIQNATVEFVVKGNSYISTTDEKGIAYLDVPFKPGAYEVKAVFAGSNNLTRAYVTNHIQVSGELLYLLSADVVKSYNNGSHYYVALFDALGQPLSGKIIKFQLGNETFENITNSDGFACFEVWFEPGQYKITATYEGAYPEEYASVSNNITVLTTLWGENITKYYDGSTMMFAAFSNFKGDVLSNTNVLLNINGITYKVKTDEYGFAVIDINLKAGNYNLTVLNTLTGQIGVYKINIQSTVVTKNLVKYYGNSARFTATFKDKNGNLLKNTKVKFILKGKSYIVKTNSKGVASLKINLIPGKYTITILNTKTNEKHKNKITIKKTIITKNKNVKSNKKINFQAKILKSNGKIAKKVTIKFNINKKTYKVKTNNKGVAKLNISLKKGIYTITTSYNGLNVKNKVRCS